MGRVSFEVPEAETKIFFMNTLKPMDPVTGQRKCQVPLYEISVPGVAKTGQKCDD